MLQRTLLLTIIMGWKMSFMFSQIDFWTPVDHHSLRLDLESRDIRPSDYNTYMLDFEQLYSHVRNMDTTFILKIPASEDVMMEFELIPTPVFSSGLAQKYPGFMSFTGKELNGGARLKFSVSPFGVNGMISMADGTTLFIDPMTRDNSAYYQVYDKRNFNKKTGNFSCGISYPEMNWDGFEPDRSMGLRQSGPCQFMQYRLALACTGEYAAFHGGTIERVLAAYNNTMTRVNGVYERELGVTMLLIDETDKLIFTNASTDPYSNTNGSAMLGQNQETIDEIIGRNNYDIGHVFSTGGGGIASLRSVCTSRKAQGVTGQPRPVGDPFDIDYVAHEIGHQFGANHTQNNNCQRNSFTAMEPGSASTIMGYAGICSPNVQNFSDDYFHGISLQEMQNFIFAGQGGVCAEIISTDNDNPEIILSQNTYHIPVSTPFVLSADASDVNGDMLTYCWEQFDNQVAEMPPRGTSIEGPNFRSFAPSTSHSRYFPSLGVRNPTWEVLPSVEREMNFRLTVRDNHILYGCTNETDVTVHVSPSSGPFRVTAPNSQGLTWRVGSQQSVVWNVANTQLPPVSCEEVDIFLSTDGGLSFPHLLASRVPNTGQAQIVVPNMATSTARVMVKASDNIFFHTTSINVRITTSFSMAVPTNEISLCDEDFLTFSADLVDEPGFSGPLLLSVSGLPPAVDAFIEPESHSFLPASSTVTLNRLSQLPLGQHNLILEGNVQQETQTLDISIYKYQNTPGKVDLTTPENNTSNLSSSQIEMSWSLMEGVKEYRIQVSTHPLFDNLVFDAFSESNTIFLDLDDATIYYWRVHAVSPCFSEVWSDTHVFTTQGFAPGQPVIVAHNPLIVNRNETAVFSPSEMDIAGDNPGMIRFTVITIPRHGTLILEGSPVFPGHVFTLTDIQSGVLSYVHDGGSEDRDGFTVNVLDDKNRLLPDWALEIQIIQQEYGFYTQSFNVKCFGGRDGLISVFPFNGQPPYQYSLDGILFQDSSLFDGLPAGTYDVTVRDNDGVMVQNQVNLTESPPLGLDIIQNFYDFEMLGSGGSGKYLYSFNNSLFVAEPVINDPDNGFYSVRLKDELGCILEKDLTVDIPVLQLDYDVVNDIICFGQNARVRILAGGGFPPYQYSKDSINFQLSDTLVLDAGAHFFFVADNGGKTIKSEVWKSQNPAAISIFPERTGFTHVMNGSGGTGPLEYSTDNIQFSENDTIVFPSNGNYTVYVRDSVGCQNEFDIRVSILSKVSIVQRDAKCFKSANGFLSISPSDGKFPFMFKLNNGEFQTLNRWSNLTAGIYEYTVKDNIGDSISDTVIIGEPDSLYFTIFRTSDVLRIDAAGGTPPYRYSLNGGDSFLDINEFSDLDSGEYVIVVTDANGCLSQMVNFSTSVMVHENSSVLLYPNPASEVLTVQGLGQIHLKKLIIRNNLGQVLKIRENFQENENFFTLNIIDWPAGIYLLQLETAKGTQLIRWIKI